MAVVDAACLPLTTNGRRDAAVYRVTRAPTHGQLLHRDGRAAEEFTQRQVRRLRSTISFNKKSSAVAERPRDASGH